MRLCVCLCACVGGGTAHANILFQRVFQGCGSRGLPQTSSLEAGCVGREGVTTGSLAPGALFLAAPIEFASMGELPTICRTLCTFL